MVLRLADVLALPRAGATGLLGVAGFAAQYPTLKLDAAGMGEVRAAMD